LKPHEKLHAPLHVESMKMGLVGLEVLWAVSMKFTVF
jgi:hypothetical protein